MRIRRISGVVMLAIGLGTVAGPTGARAAEPLPPLLTTLEAVTDGAADDIVPPAEPPTAEPDPATLAQGQNPRADITSASLEYAPGWIRMKVQVKTPTDPLKDKAWSDRSDAEWALDTNADGKPEYSVEFATDQGELYGAVFDVNKPDEKALCDADSASFSPEDGYTLVIDPKCIGNPKALGYSVAMFFATNTNDENAPMATDRVPDQGFKEIAAPAQPGEAPAAAPPAPAAPVTPNAAPSVTRGPAAAAAPKAGTAASAPRAAASAPSAAAAQSSDPAAGTTTAPGAPLARTGSASVQRGLFGFGIMLVGAGLLVMTRPARRLAPIAR